MLTLWRYVRRSAQLVHAAPLSGALKLPWARFSPFIRFQKPSRLTQHTATLCTESNT